MRTFLRAIVAAALVAGAGAAAAGGYVLTVDGKTSELDLDKDTAVVVDGKTVTVKLQRKEQQVFRDRGLSFEHPAIVQPSTTDISKGVRQVMLVSANGNGVILQRYDGIDPTALVDLMVKEMTDEEVAAGYQRTIEAATRKLPDGRDLAGKYARTQSKDESWDRYVYALADGRGGGYLLVTMMEEDRAAADVAMLDRFWKTLKLD
ncbi:MAG TPA: hypothetical protein VLF18_19785 [Tahibacter sp.]|uniref:hypothetical protein n=1 Tax=Tahibacter sp. TaxID=2056211 RepID=UPI002BB5D5FB|nr:hypothetical protein [Tahibacter sp.]HSX62432.1 hypothetical protein [Tahibacter sp.]